MSLMGLDIGTTGAKAVVFAEDARILSSAYREYPIHSPRPGWLELDPEEVWRLAAEAVAEAARGAREPVAALAISCLGEAVVALDAKGKLLGRTILGFDNRAEALADAWLRVHDAAEVMRISGMPPSQVFSLFKLMWLRENEPALWRRVRRVHCYQDYAVFRMGLPPMADYSIAARTMALDVRRKCWSERLGEMAQIDPGLWSPVAASGTVIGELGAKSAAALGLPKGCKVVTGAHDQPAGAVGSGVIRDGLMMDATGTVECIALAFREPVTTHTMMASHFCCYPHMAPDLYLTIAFNPTGGSLLRWFRDQLAVDERRRAQTEKRDVYDLIFDGMAEDAGNLFVLPHFAMAGNPYMDPSATGAIVGLSLTTTRGELIRALVEGITYEMKHNLRLFEQEGLKAREIRAIGGGARSERWLQLKADMFHRPVLRPAVTEAACLGAAMAAGVGAGAFATFGEAVERLVRTDRVFEPDPTRARMYDERLETYRRLYPAVRAFRTGTPLEGRK